MPKYDTLPHNLQKKEVVKAAIDLRGVPQGTTGQVIISNGLDWVRYLVAFDNGVEVGCLHRDKLIREDEWDDYLLKREQTLQKAENETELTDDSEEPPSSSGSGGVEVNGVLVPQLLLDRTQAALERFGVSR